MVRNPGRRSRLLERSAAGTLVMRGLPNHGVILSER